MDFHLIDFVEHVLNVVVLFLLLRTFLYKPVKKFMTEREAKFAGERAEIDADRKQAETLKAQYEASIESAKVAAEKIAEDKRNAVEREADDMRDKARREAQRILADAKAQAATEHEEMLSELKAFPLLTGYRGRPVGDVDAACVAIAAFSRAVLALQEQADEVEVNPLLVRPAGQGACMLDALVLAQPAQD